MAKKDCQCTPHQQRFPSDAPEGSRLTNARPLTELLQQYDNPSQGGLRIPRPVRTGETNFSFESHTAGKKK
jgi:hypothetical protein